MDILVVNKLYHKAASVLQDILKDDGFVSQRDKSKFDFYIQLCEHMSEHAAEMQGLDCEKIMRDGIKKYPDEVGNLWVRLAEFFIRQGQFNHAREIFQEAVNEVMTARDFGTIYSAYLKFEEEMVEVVSAEEIEENDRTAEEVERELERLQQEIEAQINRLENLIEGRP